MASRVSCWLHGHEWGRWHGGYVNLFGVPFRVRWCDQCGARDQAAA